MPSIYFGNTKAKKIYYGSTQIKKVYYGSTLVYQADPYTPGAVLLNISNAGSGTVNFYKGKYHIYAQGAGGGGGRSVYFAHAGGGGSGAGFNGYIVFTEDVLNVACSTAAGAGELQVGVATVINGIFNLGGGGTGQNDGWNAGVGGTYTFTSDSRWYIESSTVAGNGNSGFAGNASTTPSYGGNSVLTNSGGGTANNNATALGAGGGGGRASHVGMTGGGGQCVIKYIGQV